MRLAYKYTTKSVDRGDIWNHASESSDRMIYGNPSLSERSIRSFWQ
ncbi:hypothetical protein [Microcoleus sp. herbarium14]